jgi:outer membrane protein TolC
MSAAMVNSFVGRPIFAIVLALSTQIVANFDGGFDPGVAAVAFQDETTPRPVRSGSCSPPSEPIHAVSARSHGNGEDAYRSGRSMPRSDADHGSRAIRRQSWLIGLVFTIGCAHSQSDLQNRLARRVVQADVGAVRSTSPPEPKTSDRATSDTRVRLATASQPGQANEARIENDRSGPVPPALEGSPRRSDPDQPPSPATSLPSDSDVATLDAIAATGKPLTLPEATDLAFRLQPRLRAQLESIAQARGAEQIAFSAFLPIVAGRYDVGAYSLGAGGIPVQVGRPLRFNFIPSLGTVPIGLNLGTTFELAELKVQWLLLDFGRRLGLYEQAKLAGDIARLQTERAHQTVANEVAVAYYDVLRSQALRRTAQDALRRAEEELVDARKREREGVIEREIVLRAEVQTAEYRQALHAATEAEFVALAGLNLAIGLKCNEPLRVVDPTEVPPLAPCLADCLQTAIQQRREFYVVQRTVDVAVQGGRIARAQFAPKVVADGTLLDLQQQQLNGHVDLRLGFIRLEWALFEGGRRIAAARVADSNVRQAMAQAESIVDNIAFQVNEAYRNAVTAWVSIDDARPAVDQATENYRLVRLRLREGAAIPSEIADAQASLTRAQQNYLNARYGYLIAMDRLAYAMGVGPTPISQALGHH